MIYLYPKKINASDYPETEKDLKVFYGLPREIEFCKSCTISNQRPNSAIEFQHSIETTKATIRFNENGICDACSVGESKKNIDWDLRDKELQELCDRYRKNDGSYDCLVPGSGGKDSFYAAHILKYKYKMHPLTVTWAPHIHTDWGWKNFQAWIHAGLDNYLFTPNGRVHRLLTRLALETIFHPFQPFMLGQMVFPPKLATILNIPLVFYGENPSEYGNPKQDMNKATKNWDFFSTNDSSKVYLSGVPISELKGKFKLNDNELSPYLPVNPKAIQEKNIEIHYLGYYLKWHPQSCYYYSVEHGGFQAAPERTPGTYSKYNSIDDKMDDLQYYTQYIKFGIGRATYDSSQEIRSGDITREEGVALAKKFDGEFPERFIEELLRYLSIPEKEFPDAFKLFEKPVMDRQYFALLADKFRSPHIWKKTNDNWVMRHAVWEKTSHLGDLGLEWRKDSESKWNSNI